MDYIHNYTSSKPFYEKNINVLFPNKLGSFELVNVMDYERQSPGLGVSLGYNGYKSNVTICVYKKAINSFEKGIESDIIIKEMDYSIEEIYQMENSGEYHRVNVYSPKKITYDVGENKLSFRCTIANYVSMSEEMVSLILLCGYKNHIIKIRYTTSKSIFIDTTEGEKLFDGFMSGLCNLLCQ